MAVDGPLAPAVLLRHARGALLSPPATGLAKVERPNGGAIVEAETKAPELAEARTCVGVGKGCHEDAKDNQDCSHDEHSISGHDEPH